VSEAESRRDYQADVDAYLKSLTAQSSPEEAAYAVAVVLNRAAAELHRLARAEATARRGAADWGAWAALQNSARTLVLQSSSARDLAAKPTGRSR
jgi:hypothetical protein